MPTIPVLVPRRDDNGARDKIWRRIQHSIWTPSSHQIVEGHHDGPGPFNRAAALNTAAQAAGDWELAIIADSDSFVPDEQLAAAIDLASREQRLVFAHSMWVNVAPEELPRFIALRALTWDDQRVIYHHTVSSMLVVPRTVWDAVDGFDEAFAGYGYEDNAFARACRVLTGDPLRIFGPVYHLAHDDAPRPRMQALAARDRHVAANRIRWQQYQRARTTAEIRALRRALVDA